MFVQVQNENYGYSTTTYGDYVVITNPPSIRYSNQNRFTGSWDSASMKWEVWDSYWNSGVTSRTSALFGGSIDCYKYNKNTDQHDFVNSLTKKFESYLVISSEIFNIPPTSSIDTESGLDLVIDDSLYTHSIEDGFGASSDMYEKLLVVGSPYYTQIIATTSSMLKLSGSSVEIHDFSRTEFIPLSQSSYIASLYNPDSLITESFGKSVSINDSWIAVGSPIINSSLGMVYMYKNISSGSNYAWTLFQKITPSGSLSTALFGRDVKLNKASGSNSMIVGCGNNSNAQAYYFEFLSGSWTQTYTFYPTTDILPLTFNDYNPYNATLNIANGFGYAVSTFGDSVIIGAPLDRTVYEFSGSLLYQQGSAYIFEKCKDQSYTQFELVLKTYGDINTLKNNRLGYSVDIFENNAIVGIPKINNNSMTSCYVGGTIEQLHQCNSDFENLLTGQTMLLQKNTESLDWNILNVYQKKKNYLSPYRTYGNDVSVADKSFVVGSPMTLIDSYYQIDVNITQSNDINLDNICGKSYIYNFKNLRDEFHVGNVFYKNGKIILMTSGSMFDGLFFNPINNTTYEYDLKFKGQHTIFEKQVICTVSPGEFNVSTNPSAINKPISILDINNNSLFDFQDVDVLLSYMQYKNTSILGIPVSTDWSSSIVITDDEISLLNYYKSQNSYNVKNTSKIVSESISRWEIVDTSMQNVLDLNDDNKIDIRDMKILWKYFSNRLTQENYSTYITPACKRKDFGDIIEYMDSISNRTVSPKIKSQFFDYENLAENDKTGSFLAPFVTTIGLYSGLDLIGISKLGTPIKIIQEIPINFVVKMDY